MSAARPPEGAHTVAEGEGVPVGAARPPEGAHTVAEGEGAPVGAARPPEGAHTAAEGEGVPVGAARPPEGAHWTTLLPVEVVGKQKHRVEPLTAPLGLPVFASPEPMVREVVARVGAAT
ncbi:hypothetical protein [Verminephrobacter eiseniae]|uniref:hypothetical protein n=1 Tax=Verminephrobacter eiseniae TaxID=364317 RepID=UPI00223909C8|nr:hypothetical protein [Verminephrobacter eiseniae]